MKCWMMGRPKTAVDVELDDLSEDEGGCYACEYVDQNVKTVLGGIAFVEYERGEIRRVECVAAGLPRAYVCEEVSRESAKREIGEGAPS